MVFSPPPQRLVEIRHGGAQGAFGFDAVEFRRQQASFRVDDLELAGDAMRVAQLGQKCLEIRTSAMEFSILAWLPMV